MTHDSESSEIVNHPHQPQWVIEDQLGSTFERMISAEITPYSMITPFSHCHGSKEVLQDGSS